MRDRDDVSLGEQFSGSKRLAMKFGVNAAIVHKTLAYHIKEAQAKKRNLRNGRYWYYATYTELSDKLPFFTERQIRSAIRILEEAHLITTAHFKGSPQPHTTWYDIPDTTMKYAYPHLNRQNQNDTQVSQSDIHVTQSDTNVIQSDNFVTSTNLIYNHSNTHMNTIEEKENIIKEKDNVPDGDKPFSHADYKRISEALPPLHFTTQDYLRIKEVSDVLNVDNTIEVIHDTCDGKFFKSTTEAVDAIQITANRDLDFYVKYRGLNINPNTRIKFK